VGGRLHHPPRGARRTDVAPLAAERDQEVVATAGAIGAAKPVHQDTALEVVAEGGLDMERHRLELAATALAAGQIGLEVLAGNPVQQRPRGSAWTIEHRTRRDGGWRAGNTGHGAPCRPKAAGGRTGTSRRLSLLSDTPNI